LTKQLVAVRRTETSGAVGFIEQTSCIIARFITVVVSDHELDVTAFTALTG
jgi:hypothetical protein